MCACHYCLICYDNSLPCASVVDRLVAHRVGRLFRASHGDPAMLTCIALGVAADAAAGLKLLSSVLSQCRSSSRWQTRHPCSSCHSRSCHSPQHPEQWQRRSIHGSEHSSSSSSSTTAAACPPRHISQVQLAVRSVAVAAQPAPQAITGFPGGCCTANACNKQLRYVMSSTCTPAGSSIWRLT